MLPIGFNSLLISCLEMDTLKNLNPTEEEEDDDDEDDEDYVPSKEDLENDDDVDKDDDAEGSSDSGSDEGDGDDLNKVKKTKKRGRKRKVSASNDNAENVSEDGKKELTIEEKKKKADDLWAELNQTSSNKTESKPKVDSKTSSEIKSEEKVYDFAGETVVIKETPKDKTIISSSSSSSAQSTNSRIPVRRSGLKDLVSNLGKKSKLGTLQKSKLDWDSFKREEGIEDELKQATLSKDGYVERQAFLTRADVRQFEIEKSIRSKIRKPQ